MPARIGKQGMDVDRTCHSKADQYRSEALKCAAKAREFRDPVWKSYYEALERKWLKLARAFDKIDRPAGAVILQFRLADSGSTEPPISSSVPTRHISTRSPGHFERDRTPP